MTYFLKSKPLRRICVVNDEKIVLEMTWPKWRCWPPCATTIFSTGKVVTRFLQSKPFRRENVVPDEKPHWR